jgi:hypothetical protein
LIHQEVIEINIRYFVRISLPDLVMRNV